MYSQLVRNYAVDSLAPQKAHPEEVKTLRKETLGASPISYMTSPLYDLWLLVTHIHLLVHYILSVPLVATRFS